jgi:hypothetical protein
VADRKGVDMPDRTCSIEGCGRPQRRREWCSQHYARWYRIGDVGAERPIRARVSTAERYWSKVNKTDDHWLWTDTPNSGGYGTFKAHGQTYGAHHYGLILAGIDVPAGLEIDHLCCVPLCVRPDHLEPGVTHQVNMDRRALTRCKNGHEFTDANTYWQAGSRLCRHCQADRHRRYREEGRYT